MVQGGFFKRKLDMLTLLKCYGYSGESIYFYDVPLSLVNTTTNSLVPNVDKNQ